ncbi:RNI-like protein [Xylariaceae sp. FL0016]|nr:RNI-like protein [Xylariaceae sp. FL0016]
MRRTSSLKMEPENNAPHISDGRDLQKAQRRASFSPMKAIRSLSISSQISHLSIASDTDLSSTGTTRRRTLRRNRAPGSLKEKKGLIRKPSNKSSIVDTADADSVSTRPTTPSGAGSRGNSIYGDFATAIKSGALQPETSLLKAKKAYLVLTPSALVKFKSRAAAAEQFPQVAPSDNALAPLTPVETQASSKGYGSGTGVETLVPLERVVTVYRDEGTRPSFGIEVWWRSSDPTSSFSCLQLDFRLPDERESWLKEIQRAVKQRARSCPDEQTPTDVELDIRLILNAKNKTDKDSPVEIFPVVPRRPYTRLRANSGEVKKNWREASSFYVAFSKYSLLLAQFTRSSTGQKVNPSLVQFGLVTLARVNANSNDERFDLVFRLPLDQPKTLELSSRHHRTILLKLFKADTYLKPAWPLWTRREVFFVDGEAQHVPLPNGEDYGGFKTTLEAFLEGFHCTPVAWTVQWKGVRYPPEFRLLPPKSQGSYTSHQLLAVFRALRFNDYFKSLSFRDVDFSNLSDAYDNIKRLESTIWLSRTGKRSLTRSEFELVESSSVLFQELVSLLLGSESVKHIDLKNVLHKVSITNPGTRANLDPLGSNSICEIMPPIILLWKSLQTRCISINLSGNTLGETDVLELCRVFQNRPEFLKTFEASRCSLDENSLINLWEGLQEQAPTLETLDVSSNSGHVEATRVSNALDEASRLKKLNLAYAIKGHLDVPLIRPWGDTEGLNPWRLEELDLSGWKINFETLCGIMRYLELDESHSLRRLALNHCGLSGDGATGILCRIGKGRDMHLHLNENPLESGSTDWIDLIHGDETPKMLHLDMIQFQHESNFNRLLSALSHNKTIEYLSLVGTSPPTRAGSKTSQLLSKFLETNDTLKYLDLSGFSGKLEDGHLGWGLSGALGGLRENTSLRQLRVQNHDIGAAQDITELSRVLASNKGLVMFDCRNNNFDHHQFGKLVHALSFNQQLISFPISDSDREYAIEKERRIFMKNLNLPSGTLQAKLSKSQESRLVGLLTWIRNQWESEAKTAKTLLDRNTDSLAARALEFDVEYLDSWRDDELPSWLVAKPVNRNRGKERALQSPSASPVEDVSPSSITPEPTIGALGPSYGLTPGPPRRKTYIIEEEDSDPGSDMHSGDSTPPELEMISRR